MQEPRASVVQGGAEEENSVIAGGHPKRDIGLKDPTCTFKASTCEVIVSGETVEAIPIVIDAVNA